MLLFTTVWTGFYTTKSRGNEIRDFFSHNLEIPGKKYVKSPILWANDITKCFYLPFCGHFYAATKREVN